MLLLDIYIMLVNTNTYTANGNTDIMLLLTQIYSATVNTYM
jgi:hypothetical protein